MIFYGYSVQGKSHKQKNVVCQDYHYVDQLQSGYYMGVIADGVGSAAHADIGSQYAVETLFKYCNQTILPDMSVDEICRTLETGYQRALTAINRYAMNLGVETAVYDTTLSAVIYDGSCIIFGHAGDGGIVIAHQDGRMELVTDRQKGNDGISVRPLRAGISSWEFGYIENDIVAVMLVTDGLLDGVIQPALIKLPDKPEEYSNDVLAKRCVYITAAQFFMNPYAVYLNPDIQDPYQYMQYFLDGMLTQRDQDTFLDCMYAAYTKLFDENIAQEICTGVGMYQYTCWAFNHVMDDKTVVCIMNEAANVYPDSVSYFYEPDWKMRQSCYERILYGNDIAMSPDADCDHSAEG